MTLTTEWVLAVLGAGTTVAVGIFQGAFYLGRMWARLEQHESRLDEQDKRLDDFDTSLSRCQEEHDRP